MTGRDFVDLEASDSGHSSSDESDMDTQGSLCGFIDDREYEEAPLNEYRAVDNMNVNVSDYDPSNFELVFRASVPFQMSREGRKVLVDKKRLAHDENESSTYGRILSGIDKMVSALSRKSSFETLFLRPIGSRTTCFRHKQITFEVCSNGSRTRVKPQIAVRELPSTTRALFLKGLVYEFDIRRSAQSILVGLADYTRYKLDQLSERLDTEERRKFLEVNGCSSAEMNVWMARFDTSSFCTPLLESAAQPTDAFRARIRDEMGGIATLDSAKKCIHMACHGGSVNPAHTTLVALRSEVVEVINRLCLCDESIKKLCMICAEDARRDDKSKLGKQVSALTTLVESRVVDIMVETLQDQGFQTIGVAGDAVFVTSSSILSDEDMEANVGLLSTRVKQHTRSLNVLVPWEKDDYGAFKGFDVHVSVSKLTAPANTRSDSPGVLQRAVARTAPGSPQRGSTRRIVESDSDSDDDMFPNERMTPTTALAGALEDGLSVGSQSLSSSLGTQRAMHTVDPNAFLRTIQEDEIVLTPDAEQEVYEFIAQHQGKKLRKEEKVDVLLGLLTIINAHGLLCEVDGRPCQLFRARYIYKDRIKGFPLFRAITVDGAVPEFKNRVFDYASNWDKVMTRFIGNLVPWDLLEPLKISRLTISRRLLTESQYGDSFGKFSPDENGIPLVEIFNNPVTEYVLLCVKG